VTTLGLSDLDVLPMALGANTFGWTASPEASFEILNEFIAGGGSLVDTADAYSIWAPGNSGGESESVIGGWLAAGGPRDRLVISTKVSEHPKYKGLSAANVAAAAEQSLRRLQTDQIDLYFAHVDDPLTPLDETVAAFAELIELKKIRYVGLSNYSAERIREWLEIAARLGVDAPVALQPHYNLLVREPFESEIRPVAEQHNLAVIPYFGLAAGFLSGKYRTPQDAEGAARGSMVASYLTDTGFAAAAEVRLIAEERGVQPAAVALAWLRMQRAITAPIAGATSVDQVKPLLDAATMELNEAELDRLEQASSAFQPA
jgi:aryl-alcohol dehydrogenase-like predicted oxidoreductase